MRARSVFGWSVQPGAVTGRDPSSMTMRFASVRSGPILLGNALGGAMCFLHRTAVDSCQAGCPWYRGPRRRAMAGGHSHLRRREERAGMLFAAPWILGFALFTLGPMLMSLYLGFTQYSIA